MTPEVGDYLAKARHALAEARTVMGIGLADAAGRAAYLAAYHAAQAYIFTGTGQAAKTHSGVRSEFSRLAKNDPRIDRSFLTFLAQAYTLKEMADYEMGPGAVVPPERAAAAIEIAAPPLYFHTELPDAQAIGFTGLRFWAHRTIGKIKHVTALHNMSDQ